MKHVSFTDYLKNRKIDKKKELRNRTIDARTLKFNSLNLIH